MRQLVSLCVLLVIHACGLGDRTADRDTGAPRRLFLVDGQEVPVGELEAVGFVLSPIGACTGTLISDTSVLTAAHCVCTGLRPGDPRGCVGSASFIFKEVLPADDPATPFDESSARGDVAIDGSVSVHPDYATLGFVNHDFALIELDEPASRRLKAAVPIPVAGPDKPKVGDLLTLVGFGKTGDECGAPAMGKRRVDLDIQKITSGNVTLRLGEKTNGSCPGDSGGPALGEDGTVVGVASTGGGGDDADYDPTYLAFSWLASERERAATVVVSPRSLSFGKVRQKDVVDRVLSLSNDSAGPVQITIAGSPAPPQGQPISGFFWPDRDQLLAPATTAHVVVSFVPRAAAEFSATLRVERSPGGDVVVRLRGEGLPAGPPP